MRRIALITAATLVTFPAFARYDWMTVGGEQRWCEVLPAGGLYCDPPQQQTFDSQRPARRITSEAPRRQPPKPVPPPADVPPDSVPTVVVHEPEPSADLPYDAGPSDYLRAALDAIHDRNATTADEALERAETRLLSRSVPLGATDIPIRGHTDATIRQARQAVAADDRDGAERLIDRAMQHRGGPQREASSRPINYP